MWTVKTETPPRKPKQVTTLPSHDEPVNVLATSDSEHESATSCDSQANIIEYNGEKFIKLDTYMSTIKIQASCEKAYQQLSLVKAALHKTQDYIAQREADITQVIDEFCEEMGYKPQGFAVIQSHLQKQQPTKRQADQDIPVQTKKPKEAAPQPNPPPSSQPTNTISAEQASKIQQQYVAALQARQQQAQQQQMLQQQQYIQRIQNPPLYGMPENQMQYNNVQPASVTPKDVHLNNRDAQQQISRYWNDAMYNLISRAQGQTPKPLNQPVQTPQKEIKKEVTEERTTTKSSEVSETRISDSGHDSHSDNEKKGKTTSEETEEKSTPKSSKAQVKPQWIVKRMEKLKTTKKADKQEEQQEIDIEDDDDATEYLPLDADIPAPELVDDEEMDAEIDVDISGAAGNQSAAAALTQAQKNKVQKPPLRDPKSYTINCKQCRWTLRKWDGWARKRNAGELKHVTDSEVAPVDFLDLRETKDLVYWMSKFIREIRKDSGEAYQIDSITAFAFSLQKVLKETGRQVDILRNERFVPFLEAMNDAMDLSVKTVVLNPTPRQDEESLWVNGELGYHTPEALVQTICLIMVKHLKVRSSQAHRDLEITDLEKVKVFNPHNPTQVIDIYRLKDTRNLATTRRVEILPNIGNPERCPVRLLDFYLEKRPPAIRHSGPLYLWPSDQSKTPTSFCWYRVKPLSKKYILKCLFKIKQTNLQEV